MDTRSTGIILRNRPLTESSLIVSWITPDLGRITTVAKGAKRPKSPLRGKLDLFYKAEISFAHSPRSQLHNLREVVLLETYPPIRCDYDRLQQASYVAKLVEQTTETESEIRGIYQLVEGFLTILSAGHPSPRYPLAFELKLVVELGLQPDFKDLPEELLPLACALMEGEWKALQSMNITASQGRQLVQFMHRFLVFQFGRVPSARNNVMLKGGKIKTAE